MNCGKHNNHGVAAQPLPYKYLSMPALKLNYFNKGIWKSDVSRVFDMASMITGVASFSGDISELNVSSVIVSSRKRHRSRCSYVIVGLLGCVHRHARVLCLKL